MGGLAWLQPTSLGNPDALPAWEIIGRAYANLPSLAAIRWTGACMLRAACTQLQRCPSAPSCWEGSREPLHPSSHRPAQLWP